MKVICDLEYIRSMVKYIEGSRDTLQKEDLISPILLARTVVFHCTFDPYTSV